MMSCDFNHASFGNVLEQPLWQVWENLTTHPTFQEAKWGGCKVRDEEYRDRDEVCTGRPPQRGRARLMEMTAERTGGPDADNGQHT